jgi:CheY-like chemotaxis protein
MGQNLVVLLLDEDAGSRQRLAIRLEPLGFTVFQAGTFDEAFSLSTEKVPDLLIMEWGAQNRSGSEIVRELKMAPANIYVFTAKPLETIIQDVNRCGVKAVFRKSERIELLEHLEKLQEVKSSPKGSSSTPFAGAHELDVLVIDDSSTVRLSLRLALQEHFPNCSVREADDGHAAFVEMGHKKVDLLITDLEMPGMNGREFLARIDANPILRKKLIVVFSGHITSDLHKAYEDRPNICFLMKPCTPQQVVETVVKMLAESKTV